MGKTLFRFIILACVVGFALFIAGLNSDPITITLGPSLSTKTTSGILLLSSFTCGVVIAGLVGLFFSLRSYLRERRAVNALTYNIKVKDEFINAVALTSEGSLNLAESELVRLKKKNPDDVLIAKELSYVKEKKGDIKGALSVIEELRQRHINSPILLLKASRLYSLIGNSTAALDNLLLLSRSNSSVIIAEKAREEAIKAKKFEEALEAQKKVESAINDNKEEVLNKRALIETEILVKKASFDNTDPEDVIHGIQSLLRRAPTCGHAYSALRDQFKKLNKYNEAAELGAKAGRLTMDLGLLKESSEEFISLQQPAKAIAAIKACCNAWSGKAKLDALILLADTALRLAMFNEAKISLDEAYQMTIKDFAELKPQVIARLAKFHIRTGNSKEAIALWDEVLPGETKSPVLLLTGNAALAPEFSTP